jgi:S1-C subfamily serine protease
LRKERLVVTGDNGIWRHYITAISTARGIRRVRVSAKIESPIDRFFGRMAVTMAGLMRIARPDAISPQVPERHQPRDRTSPKPTASTGSGIIVDRSGHIVSNDHVVGRCGSLIVKGYGPARLVKRDPTNDIALIKVRVSEDVTAATFRRGDAEFGEKILAFGYPLSFLSASIKVTGGMVSSLTGIADDSRFIQISAPIQPGSSGGPLVDQSGLIIGVVTSKLNQIVTLKYAGVIPENVAFALRASMVKSFLSGALVLK